MQISQVRGPSKMSDVMSTCVLGLLNNPLYLSPTEFLFCILKILVWWSLIGPTNQ